MHYLKDVVNVLSEFSCSFQRDDVTLNTAIAAIETADLQLISLSQEPGKEFNHFLAELKEGSYCGVQLLY